MGYKTEQKLIAKNIQTINFKLVADAYNLPVVIVNNNIPLVRSKKDTIEYDVKGFSNQQDRVIGDIIKKLPGIEVDNDGRILFQGKAITQFFIDGDDLLSDNYNVAANNIPVDFVSKIQILENYQHIKVLKKINFTDKPALNLVLNDKARIRISGMGDLSMGLPALYDANLQAQLFKKNLKFINLLKFNNTGNDLKSDVFSHSANDLGQTETGPLITLPTLNPPLEDKRDLFNHSVLLDVNGIYKLSKESQISLNTYYLGNRLDQSNELSRTIYLPGDTIPFKENQNAHSKENSFHTKITVTSNKSDFYFNNALQFENTPKTITSNLTTQPGGEIAQLLNSKSVKFSNDLLGIRMLGKKFAIEGRSYVSVNSNPVNLNIQPALVDSFFITATSFKGLEQTANTPSTYIENYVSTTIPGKVIQTYKIGFVSEKINLNSQLGEILNSDSISPISDSGQNKLNWRKQQLYFEPKLAIHTDRFQADLALTLQQQSISYSDSIINNHSNNVLILPSFNSKILIGKEDNILFNSSYTNEFGNIQNVYPNYIMTDYQTLTRNYGILPQKRIFTNSLIFNYRETLKLLFISMGISYSIRDNNSILDYQYTPYSISANNRSFSNSSNAIKLVASASKYLFPLQTTLAASFSLTGEKVNQFQNSELIEYQNMIKQMHYKINSKVSEKVNFSYDGVFNYFENKPLVNNSMQNTESQSGQSFLQKFGVNYNLNVFNSFKIGGEYYYSKLPSNTANKLLFMDAGWYYRSKNGKNDFSVSINNILNAGNYQQVSLNSNIIEVNEYKIRPASLVIKYLFRL